MSLGDILTKTVRDEKSASERLQRERAEAESAEARKAYQAVTDLFEDAKRTLTEQITKRVATDKLGVLVGSDGSRKGHKDAYDALKLYHDTSMLTDTRSRYYPLWKAFKDWAASQGLTPKMDYRWDGGGMYSWYVLTVELPKT